MRKSFRIFSMLIAVVIIFSSVSTGVFFVSGNSDNNQINAVYDFEDSDDYLDFGIFTNTYEKDFDNDGVTDGSLVKVMTENEGTDAENNFLRIQSQTWKRAIVNFPFVLENGATYTLTYKVRDDGTSSLDQREDESKKGAGFFVGKSTGHTELNADAQMDVLTHLGNKLCNIYGNNGMYAKLFKASFTTVSHTFTVGEDDVNSDFKYLAINYCCSNGKYKYIDIDDISIVKTPKIDRSTISFVTNISEITFDDITDTVGSTRSFDYFSVYGYDLDGVYTDSAFTIPYTQENIVFGSENTTLFIKLKPGDNSVLKFENDYDVLKTGGAFSYADVMKDDGSYNRALAFSKSTSFAVLPYKIEPNTEYVLNFKYKASSSAISPRLYVLAGNDGDGDIVENNSLTDTRQFAVFGSEDLTATEYVTVTDFDWQWREVTFKFKTNDTVTDVYDHLVLAGRVPFNVDASENGYLYIDDFQLNEYVGEITFDVSYEGQSIDVNPIYTKIGDVVSLPQKVIEPFELEGWYTDPEFTQKISGDKYTVTSQNTILYGKVSYKNTAHIDFEDSSQVLFSYANWSSVLSQLKTDDDDIDNHLLKMRVTGLNMYDIRINYQFRQNRVYEISVRYRAVEESNNTVLALSALGILNQNNGFGTVYHDSSNRSFSSIAPLITKSTVPNEWTEVTATLSTDQPIIDDTFKYLSVFLQSGTTNGVAIEIDDIVIIDKGAFDPKKININDFNSWPTEEEDMSVWKDSASWVTGEIIENTQTPEIEEEKDLFEEENFFEEEENNELEEIEQTTTKKRRKKKVVTTVVSGSWLPLILGIVSAVLVVATAVIVFFVIRRKRKNRG